MGQAHKQSVHVVEAAEQISVLMDGELAPHEVDAVLDLAKGDAGMADWSTYQLIGDALRSEDLTHAGSTADFLSRFSARLEAEPHVLVPAVAQASARHRLLVRPSWVRRALPGTAIAAAVAAVSWVVVPQMRGPAGLAAPEAVVARADAPTAAPAAGIVTVAETQMIRDPRLDEYLRAHRTSVATDAFVPTMRTVANGASFSQENTQE
ncbi:sigma-E factor negative regulatory protein [Cupriavidus oxalaticus]|jgi:sigma-E factor negative regulatory protein RseA|uniref:Anti-sigma factor n=1 Tax=Cupriavidus oxalaticus TaxID=96344 RepID=A0A375G0I6_9BURK|nr:sigma-E factor negative regulatory protein [Cupriavidus oxalaticus]QEZ47253.1 anti-sigma factor [Cupriavidus oxalaticus]QRQ88455.1 sigma-E factor negative regulatory protein [Cupriavidus oxalaticus]QRQ93218.1 sigma-E factor negative regulatory protein [Cupriavidus oxalaticus]WQD81832.1 sigma-E factor negative regulatory protein [Cupriavidus oxalaticus]SPC13211.1 Negative regulator of sigma24 activity [Cupriavidus oxalaticus]